MNLTVQIIAISMGVLFNILVFQMLRKGILDFKYTVMWIFSGVFMLIASIFPKSVSFLTGLVGISEPINFLFFFGILFLLIMLLQMTIIVSKYKDRIYQLTQRLAILQKKVDDLSISDNRQGSGRVS